MAQSCRPLRCEKMVLRGRKGGETVEAYFPQGKFHMEWAGATYRGDITRSLQKIS
jgi:hypothetical protein